MTTTREAFLSRIRQQVAASPGLFPASTAERPRDPVARADIVRREMAERWPQTLERFRREFERVGGTFHRVAEPADVAVVVGEIARARGARRLVTWSPRALGFEAAAPLRATGLAVAVLPDGALADESARPALRREVAEAEVGLTGADLAIGETGSLVLLSGQGRPRTTSLLPPYHVAVFDRHALVESVLQLGAFLEAWHAGASPGWRGGVVNVITGPSRTADIELTLTRGVHGPREVHAVFVDAGVPLTDLRAFPGLGRG
jgi:L-lactate dehydrogenase complex protein LldG